MLVDGLVTPVGEHLQCGQETSAEGGERVFRFQWRPAAEHMAGNEPVALQLLELAAPYRFGNAGDPFYFHGTSPALYSREQIRARAEECAGGLVELLRKLGG